MILLAIGVIFGLLGAACAIASLVFFVIVVVQMFQREESKTMGIICVVLFFVAGVVGPIVAFIFGWTKVKEWDIKKVMTYWTVAFVLQFVFIGIAVGMIAAGVVLTAPDNSDMNAAPSVEIDFGTEVEYLDDSDPFPPEQVIPLD